MIRGAVPLKSSAAKTLITAGATPLPVISGGPTKMSMPGVSGVRSFAQGSLVILRRQPGLDVAGRLAVDRKDEAFDFTGQAAVTDQFQLLIRLTPPLPHMPLAKASRTASAYGFRRQP